jgi:putative endonuclease
MQDKLFYVYIMASRAGGAIYIGVTSNLIGRCFQHREGDIDGHTKRYCIRNLVYYEVHENAESAIIREKRLKKWTRAMKNDLIHKTNPRWDDLYPSIAGTL